MHRKWLTLAVLVGMLVAAAVPGGAAAGPYSPLSCGLGFDSAHDSTECWWRTLYSIPAAGGAATLLVGAYVEHGQKAAENEGSVPPAAFEDVGDYDARTAKYKSEDVTLSPGAQVKVRVYDFLDPGRVLFSFEGTLAELMALARATAAFGGPYGVLIRIPLLVPAGQTLWIGRMDLVQGGYRCHADVFLLQGGSIIVRVV